jgi:hypothetical protein
MPPKPEFDLESAHRFFSADCFNRTWDLLDIPSRSSDEDDQMLHLGDRFPVALDPTLRLLSHQPVRWLLAGVTGLCRVGPG